jgi:hypothetical protein
MRFKPLLLILIICSACSDTPKHYADAKNFMLVSEKVSPNNKYKIIEYQFDIGAHGYSRLFWSIVPTKKKKINLYNYSLPDGYQAKGWTNGGKAIIKKWEPYYYKSEEVKLKTGDFLNGVQLVIIN